jgi:hypothetical protein
MHPRSWRLFGLNWSSMERSREWLKCKKRPDSMLKVVRDNASDRKFRLFACASARQFWHLFDSSSKRAVEVSEKFADGMANLLELSSAHDTAARQREREAWLSFQASIPAGNMAAHYCATGPGFFKAARLAGGRSEPWSSLKLIQCNLLRDIFGNPFRPVTLDPRWLSSNVIDLARTIYDERVFERMPILADALMDAGCDNEDILGHCRGSRPHVRGCWVVDLVLGKV